MEGLVGRVSSRLCNLVGPVVVDSSFVFVGNALGAVVSLINFIILARILGVAQLGCLTLVVCSVQFLNKLFNCQSGQAFIKFGMEYLENNELDSFIGLLKFILCVELATATLAFGCSLLISFFITDALNISNNIQLPVQLYAFSIFFNMHSIPTGILRIFKQFKYLSFYQVFDGLCKLCLIVLVLNSSSRLLTVVCILLSGEVISGVVLWVFSSWFLNKKVLLSKYFRERKCFGKNTHRQVLRFMVLTNLNGCVKLVYRDLDVFILKYFFNETGVGILKVAKQFSGGFQRINESVNQVLYPELVSLYYNSKLREILKLISKISIPIGILASGVLLVFSVFGGEILSVLLKPEYRQAFSVVFLFLIAESLAMVFGWMPQLILASGKPDLTLMSLSIGSFVYFVLVFTFVPKLGPLGVGVSLLVSIIVILGTMGFFIRIIIVNNRE